MAPNENVLCKRCSKIATNRVIKCVKCASVYHISCAQQARGVEYTDDEKIICCGDVTSEAVKKKEEFWDALSELSTDNKTDIRVFQYIVKQKDNLIDKLYNKISLLEDRISVLEGSRKLIPTASNVIDIADKKPDAIVKSAVNVNIRKNALKPRDGPHISSSKNDYAIPVSSAAGTVRKSENDWQVAINRKRSSRKIVFGLKEEGSENGKPSKIKAVTKLKHVHVYRLHPETTVEEMKQNLVDLVPTVECSLLPSKYPDLYASFKITVIEQHFSTIMNPELWPMGTCIREFFLPRDKRQSTKPETAKQI